MMFVLTLTITDPEDAGYFTNKTLNKLHGYIRHQQVKLALFFTLDFIKIYATKKSDLEDLLANKAVCFDIKRHIFEADLHPVTAESITVLKRMHNTLYSVNKKVTKQLNYYKNTFSLDDTALENEKKKMISYYKEQQQKQHELKRNYFIINNKDKRFTIWIEVRKIKTVAFETTAFNSYGLISSSKNNKQSF